MEQSPDEQESLLGFLGLYQTANQDGFLGALLITDRHGVPKEFRCTHPVKPTSVQKPLYGDALRPYIGVELCGNRLIESTELKPTLIFVNEDFLVRTRVKSQCPVVFVRRAGETLEIRPQSDEEVAPNKVRLECPGGRFQPITVSPHPEYADDVYSAMEEVERVFPYLDPTEPFDRIRQAIDVLAKQDARFR